MAENGQGDTEVVTFEELDLEDEKNKKPTKEEQCATFLKDKLSDQDFTEVAKILGVNTGELTNAQLLEQLTKLLAGKEKKPGEDEYPAPDEKKKEPPVEMADYKAFVKDCMGKGKTMAECADEWKKKYPEPKEGAKKPDETDKKPDEKMTALESRIAQLEEQLHMEQVSNEVSQLVSAKHLAPIQKDAVIKLSARLSSEDRSAFLEVFKTQKFKVGEDVGKATQTRPGESGKMTPERRAEIIKLHGLDDLIQDKAVKRLS